MANRCKSDGESLSHIPIHCPASKKLQNLIFALLGMTWVHHGDPAMVIDSWMDGIVGR